MSIKKREDGKWLVNLKPGGRTGKQIKKVFKTHSEAKQFEIWTLSQHQQKPEWAPVKADTRRLKELISIWFSSHGKGLSAGENTRSRLDALADKMENPTAQQLRERFADYRTARIEEGKSLSTINREHAYLRAVFNELKRLGQWKQANPIEEIRQFKVQEQELSWLTHPQIKELLTELKASQNVHAYLIAKVALSTGGRWSEVQSLNKTQVRAGVVQFANATKSKKARAVPISPALQNEIEAHIQAHPTDSNRIFEYAYSAFLSALQRTSIKLPAGQASHVLRHTFASHFMQGDGVSSGNILTLQRVLGHKDLKMTMRYAHLAPDHLQEVLKLNPLALTN